MFPHKRGGVILIKINAARRAEKPNAICVYRVREPVAKRMPAHNFGSDFSSHLMVLGGFGWGYVEGNRFGAKSF